MFDKTFSFASTDQQVSLTITAGTEGVKSLTVACEGLGSKQYTPEELLNVCKDALRADCKPTA